MDRVNIHLLDERVPPSLRTYSLVAAVKLDLFWFKKQYLVVDSI